MVVGVLEPIPGSHWVRGRNTPWTVRYSITGYMQNSLTHIPRDNLNSPVNPRVFGL
uniref:Uncharacterized protein n=1 Tax=Anguilla anguilla TaxID=7936 RepID=A0A0E9WEW7_ANGAN